MEKEPNPPVKKKVNPEYIVYPVIILAAGIAIAAGRGFFLNKTVKQVFALLTDCFGVPGIFMTGFAVLTWIAALGAFDAMGYMFSRFSLHVFLPTPKAYKKADSLYEYKEQKNKKGRKWSPPMMIVGAVSLGLGLIFMAIYAAL